MEEQNKKGQTRAKRPEVKISLCDFQALEIYGKAVDKTPGSIVVELVKEFLGKEDVKKVIAENGESAKARERIKRREEKIAKLNEENEPDRKKYGIE